MSAQIVAFIITFPLGLFLVVMGWRWTRLKQPPTMHISNSEHTRLIDEPVAKLRAAHRIGWCGVVMGLVLLLVAGLIGVQNAGQI
jgi:hypothetical protein